MQGLLRTRLLLSLLTLIVIPTATVILILFAKGYRPNLSTNSLESSGLLLTQSTPDGAHIYLNGNLKSATNTTLSLPPGQYQMEIKKDGFSPWKKDLVVQAEVVTRASAWLFPSVPSLKALTSSGSLHPVVSPDSTRIAYLSPAKTGTVLYTLDLTESPLGLINRDPKQISDFKFQISNLNWSPDSRQILVTSTTSAILVDTSSLQLRDVSDRTSQVLQTWKQTQADKESQKLASLPPKLQAILTSSASDLVWSPKENKLLYTATASATIPDDLIKALPGSNTQPQERILTPTGVYIYDLEEDRNFRIDSTIVPTPTPKNKRLQVSAAPPPPNADWAWFPSSSHLYRTENNRVIIKEYDGQNATVVYAGPMAENFAAPYPSGKQMLILTNLNPEHSPLPNLYAISLR